MAFFSCMCAPLEMLPLEMLAMSWTTRDKWEGLGMKSRNMAAPLSPMAGKIRQAGRLLDLIDRCWTALAQSKAKQH